MNKSLIPSYFKNPLWWITGKVEHDPEFWSIFANWDEEKDRLENERHNRNPWSRTKLAYTRWTTNRPRPIQAWKTFYERGTRGYSLGDTFGLSSYLVSWMPEAVAELREGSHGYPCSICDCGDMEHSDGCDGFERWQEVLRKIERGFLAARQIDNMDYWVSGDPVGSYDREKALHAEFDEGWYLAGKWFFGLWN